MLQTAAPCLSVLEKAGKGETVFIVRGQQRFMLQPVPITDPIPIRAAGYFASCYDTAELQEQNQLAKQSVIRPPPDLE